MRPRLKALTIVMLLFAALLRAGTFAQTKSPPTPTFREIVEKRLKGFGFSLADICPVDRDTAARRIFSDYGAIFVSHSDNPLPAKCIFGQGSEVSAFQRSLKTETATIGGTTVTLQQDAMAALLAAREEVLKDGRNITPRGGPTAAKRTFEDTLRFWNSRFLPGLDHWLAKGKITPAAAEAAKKDTIPGQVKKVLEWEQHGLYFSKDFSKSILYSVAAPGASQHIFMLAFDVEQFSDRKVRRVLAEHGWFQTVKSDLPHFTYLGVKEDELPSLGLKQVSVGDQIFWIPNFE